jgi:hypothetical protein
MEVWGEGAEGNIYLFADGTGKSQEECANIDHRLNIGSKLIAPLVPTLNPVSAL